LAAIALLVWIVAVARQEVYQPPAAIPYVSLAELPPEARDTLKLIKQGGPFPYRRDGTTFGNREQLLPSRPRGHYTEYTVRSPSERDRGPRRIVAGKGATGSPATGGEYYYTEDHYNSFRRILE
jgi:ribonuclease T1